MKIVGVTKCPTGIAHTYMAAQKLEEAGKALGHEVKIETQGSQGTENKLTAAEIAAADYVVIAADVAIDEKERFGGKKVASMAIQPVIKDAEAVLKNLPNTAKVQGGDAVVSSDGDKVSPVKALMNGASHMIPFVVVGGLFIALSIAIGGSATSDGMVVSEGFWSTMNAIGSQAFALMYPILAGYIAYSIAGRAALAPAMIGAEVAVTPAILGTEAGTGFLGCLVMGFAAGYLVKWFNSWPVPQSIKPIMPIFVIPLLGTGIISAAFILILAQPVSWLMTALNGLLASLASNSSSAILLGLVLGGMVAVDMGGPVNKVAFLFGTAAIAEGNPEIMGMVAAAIPVPPLACGLATLIYKNGFNDEQKSSGISALLMGLIGITEGAIPFAAEDPGRVLPSIIIGSAVAGAVAGLFGITDVVPHGGPIVGVLGATNNLGMFLVAIVIGTVVAGLLIAAFKRSADAKKAQA
jgi:fructose PTS system EIIBC or EIIC component